MAKRPRRSSLTESSSPAAASAAAGGSRAGRDTQPNSFPSATVRSLLTVWLIAHGFLVLVAYSSAIEPSAVQQRLLGFFSGYLNGLHLSLDGRPIYLAHGGWHEAAHQFQTRSSADDGQRRWTPVVTPGAVGGERRKRYQRWARGAATYAQQEQAGLAGLLARGAVSDDEVEGIRIVRLENRSIPPSLEPVEPPYEAAVVREGNQLRFVHLAPPRQNALPTIRAASGDGNYGDGNSSDGAVSSGDGAGSSDAAAVAEPAGEGQ